MKHLVDTSDDKIKKLMEPRYVCVLDYPGNPFRVSKKPFVESPEIITPDEKYPESYFKNSKTMKQNEQKQISCLG